MIVSRPMEQQGGFRVNESSWFPSVRIANIRRSYKKPSSSYGGKMSRLVAAVIGAFLASASLGLAQSAQEVTPEQYSNQIIGRLKEAGFYKPDTEETRSRILAFFHAIQDFKHSNKISGIPDQLDEKTAAALGLHAFCGSTQCVCQDGTCQPVGSWTNCACACNRNCSPGGVPK